jgi:crossover junction endodeoxyribonuclease RusA
MPRDTEGPIRISFPWPPAALTAHAKGSVWPKIKATKAYRYQAMVLSRMAKVPNAPAARLVFTWHPPRMAGDPHNLPGRVKALIDGIADAMGCDDKGFRCAFPEAFAAPVKGGAVIVEVEI